MDTGTLIVLIINFIYIGLLPLVFFKRDGRLNMMWWLTALPFVLSGSSVIASYAGYLPTALARGSWLSAATQIGCLVPALASIALISFTLGTHRIPIALWHQNNDAPREIVTWGAYKSIRHPFYSSFLLTLLSALLFAPQTLSALAFLIGLGMLTATALREERRLLDSEYGQEYQRYMQQTGRFVPRLGAKV